MKACWGAGCGCTACTRWRQDTDTGEKRCLRDHQHPPLVQRLPTRTSPEWAHCPPTGHSRPEVFHSAELGDKAQVCLPHLALVVLEEPQRPPGEGREMGEFSHARASLQLQHPHPSTGRGCPHLSPHTCSAGGACSGSLAGVALAAEPSVASAAPLASAGEGETAWRSPMATPAGQVGTASSLPHTMTGTPQPGALRG